MQIKYFSDDKLIICDDKREFTFLDLAKIYGYQIEGNPAHHWVLYQYKELVEDNKIEFELVAAYNSPSGKLAQICFGYFLNSINRRTIELNEDGTVRKDYIIFFDPRSISNNDYLYAFIPLNTKLEDYLSERKRVFENYDKSERIKNRVLDDQFLTEYIYYNNLYCKLLNYYCDNYEVFSSIINRFDEELYLRGLELDAKRASILAKE